MTDQPIYVENELFLGRLDEQEHFRETLRTVLTAPVGDTAPFIFLLHGEGGMGKSQLTRRLYDIATTEPPFERDCHALRLDWELVRNNTPTLRVAREQIHPEEVLAALHRAALDKGWGKHFEAYQEVIKQRHQTEQEVAKALDQQTEQGQYTAIRDLGASGLAKLVRLALPVGQTGEELSRALLTAGIQLGAEQAARAREQAEQFLKARLKPELYTIYRQPHEQLTRALGDGFRRVSRERPLVLLLDTYEIVAAADHWVRIIIHVAGPRMVWVIAGRDNLAASRPSDRFVGYSAEFPRHLTVWDTQELAIEYVEAYLRNRAPARPLTRDEAVAIHRATWGVPLALRQAADLWEKDLPLDAITEGTPDYAPREELVRLMCERVLLHVEHDAEGEADRRALYALAMQPRPDAEIQAAIMRLVDGIFDLHTRLAELARRYSVVRLAGGARLHEKMGEFVHEYLLRTEASASDMIKQIAGRAIELLRLRRARLEEDLFDVAERVESEDWQQTTLDLVDWLFWQDERAAWRELVPRFVEGLGYNRDLAESLLVVAHNFELKLGKDGRKRLKQLQLAEDNRDAMLAELDRLAQKGRWLDDNDAEATAERLTILTLWRGRWLIDIQRYPEALEILQTAEQTLPASATKLRQQLGLAFTQLSRRILWPPGSPFAVRTEAGVQAARRAVVLAPELSQTWSVLVSALRHTQPEETVAAAQKAVELEPQSAYHWHGLGLVYGDLRRHEEEIAAFQRAIELDPKFVRPWSALGFRYRRQGRYEEALQAYQQALEIDPNFPNCWSGLGEVYNDLDRFEEAVKAYQRAIELHPEQIYPWQARAWNGLGMVYRNQGDYTSAINAYRKSTEVDPKNAFSWVMLGGIYELAGDLEKARQSYEQAIKAQPKQGMGYISLASVLRKLGQEAEARAYITQARELTRNENVYDQACLEAIAGNTEVALEHLAQALSQSPHLRHWARRDPDLDWLHGHPRFEALVGNVG